jgi:circadian clock protein KaiB
MLARPGATAPTAPRNVITKGALRLYVTGTTLLSTRAIQNIEWLMNEELAGIYDCEVIDVLERPDLAETDGIFATPTLVRLAPGPVRKLIGDLSDRETVLASLRLGRTQPRPDVTGPAPAEAPR